jgi:hypothetical protein
MIHRSKLVIVGQLSADILMTRIRMNVFHFVTEVAKKVSVCSLILKMFYPYKS